MCVDGRGKRWQGGKMITVTGSRIPPAAAEWPIMTAFRDEIVLESVRSSEQTVLCYQAWLSQKNSFQQLLEFGTEFDCQTNP